MKRYLRPLLAALLFPVYALATVAPDADQAWSEITASGLGVELTQSPFWQELRQLKSARERQVALEQRALRLQAQCTAFMASYPADPRRWIAAFGLITNPPRFVTGYGPNYEKDPRDVTVDQAVATAWRAHLAELERQMLAAQDVPAEYREKLELFGATNALQTAFAAERNKTPADWVGAFDRVLAVAAKYPENPKLAAGVKVPLYVYESTHTPEEARSVWSRLATSPNQALAAIAAEKVRFLELSKQPIDQAFTAVDGREVDLAKWRGKVVLIDFWATWCGPCVAELPQVRQVYADYHAQGFEVVGIALEKSGVTGSDTPEQATAKLEKARRKLLDFIAKNELPWPTHFDGTKHNEGGNPLAKRFDVTAIPATFLLDQSGRVVAMNLRGEKLRVEVKRLLKL